MKIKRSYIAIIRSIILIIVVRTIFQKLDDDDTITSTKQITSPSKQTHQHQDDDESIILVRNRQKIGMNDTGPLDFIEEYDRKAIREDRRMAEEAFVRQSGYLWMQHARKAGGTTLCMILRLNQMGLIRSHTAIHKYGKRETCQIGKLCFNCSVKKKMKIMRKRNSTLTPNLSSMLIRVMDEAYQNFIEIEGSGVPDDMLDSSLWGDFVFVSTVRHPIGRLVSLLKNDYCTNMFQPRGANMTACFEYEKEHIASNSKRCDEGIYLCHSNYLVRIFSGLDTQYTNDTHMLETAKRNFQRFSCVPIVEHFQETSHCLKRLGLFLTNPGPEEAFNKDGHIEEKSRITSESSLSASSSYNAYAGDLSYEQYLNALLVNKADMEFYKWVVNFHGSLFND